MSSAETRIQFLSAPAEVKMADAWFEITHLDHFWIRRRFNVLRRLAGGLIRQAHAIAEEVRHRLFHEIDGISEAIIHTDPASHHEDFHQLMAHHVQEAQRPLAQR